MWKEQLNAALPSLAWVFIWWGIGLVDPTPCSCSWPSGPGVLPVYSHEALGATRGGNQSAQLWPETHTHIHMLSSSHAHTQVQTSTQADTGARTHLHTHTQALTHFLFLTTLTQKHTHRIIHVQSHALLLTHTRLGPAPDGKIGRASCRERV